MYTGMRERLLADRGFPVKVGIELGIGLFCKIAAEREKRKEAFPRELDFVLANVIMALIADFMLVWLPAPTLSYAPATVKKQSGLAKFIASCPDNAFQVRNLGLECTSMQISMTHCVCSVALCGVCKRKLPYLRLHLLCFCGRRGANGNARSQVVPSGQAGWSLAQRTGAVVRNGGKLLGVGFTASLLGVGITNTLLAIRQNLDPNFQPDNPKQVRPSLHAHDHLCPLSACSN